MPPRTRRAVCLQHVSFEGPAAFEPILADLGYDVDCVLVPEDRLPDDAGDALLVMGGPMSVNDPEPWLQEELGFLERTLAGPTPILGVCLGAQLLARASGGSVAPGPCFELGLVDLERTAPGDRDPCLGALPNPVPVFEWHGEGIRLPGTIPSLAGTPDFPVQAFSPRTGAYGLLFHLEVTADSLESICRNCPQDLAAAGATTEAVTSAVRPHIGRLNRCAEIFVQAWL